MYNIYMTHPGLLGGRGRDSSKTGGSVFEQLEWENPLARDSKHAGALLQPLPTPSNLKQASKEATPFQATVTNLIAIRLLKRERPFT